MKRILFGVICVYIIMLLSGCAISEEQEISQQSEEGSMQVSETVQVSEIKQHIPLIYNTYDTLQVATYLTKVEDTYFLADCYHNQILYHDNLTDELTKWKVLTSDVHYAHTIASDGSVIITDDTENNRVLVFLKDEDGYMHSQTIDGIGMKPHFVQYVEEKDLFLAWSSITGEMYYLKREKETNQVSIEKIQKLEELFGVYVRSFSVIDGDIYFVSGHNNEKIIRADLDTLELIESYCVTPEIAGMVQLVKIQDYYYITISTDNTENQDAATIIRVKDLKMLATGDYEDVYDKFGISKGTPYYITHIAGRYYMTHHRTAENLVAFDIVDNEICNVEVVY